MHDDPLIPMDILNHRFTSELAKPDSIVLPRRKASYEWLWEKEKGFGVMMERNEPAVLRLVGFMGHSKDSGLLGNQHRVHRNFDAHHISRLRMDFRVDSPPSWAPDQMLDQHIRTACMLGDLEDMARISANGELNVELRNDQVVSWLKGQSFKIGTNNIFENVETLTDSSIFNTGNYLGGAFADMRSGAVEPAELELDKYGVPIYTLLDWKELNEKTAHFSFKRGYVKATNFEVRDTNFRRIPTYNIPATFNAGTPFLATVNAVGFLSKKDKYLATKTGLPGKQDVLTLALRINTLIALVKPIPPPSPTLFVDVKKRKHGTISVADMLAYAKEKKARFVSPPLPDLVTPSPPGSPSGDDSSAVIVYIEDSFKEGYNSGLKAYSSKGKGQFEGDVDMKENAGEGSNSKKFGGDAISGKPASSV